MADVDGEAGRFGTVRGGSGDPDRFRRRVGAALLAGPLAMALVEGLRDPRVLLGGEHATASPPARRSHRR